MLRGNKIKSRGQMGLTHTRWTEEYYILPILQKMYSGQFVDLVLVNGGEEGEAKVIQVFP